MPIINNQRLRHELKYHIDFVQYQILRKKLAVVLKPDPYAGPDGRYHIRSLYFDDFRNTALCEKLAGVARRKKYRIRIYNCNDKIIKFERKTKLDHYIIKQRVTITREQANHIIAGDIAFLADSKKRILKDFYLECRCNLLRPVVMVDYYREAYVHLVGNVRITFDIGLRKNLGSMALFDLSASTMSVIEEPGVILEIKFDSILPQHIRGLFPSTIQPRSAIGKFVFCRECQPVNLC
jgi:hypothetical protein